MKKRFLSLVLAIAMMVSFCVTVPVSAKETNVGASNVDINVHVTSGNKQYKPGEMVTVNLELNNYTETATGIAGFQIELDFNGDVFDLTKIQYDDTLLKTNKNDAFSIVTDSARNNKLLCLYSTKSSDPNQAIKPDGETEKDDQGLYYILPRTNNKSVIASVNIPVKSSISADMLKQKMIVKDKLIFAGRGGLVNGVPQKEIIATLTQDTIDVVMPKVNGIVVKTAPTKTEYFVGDTLDLTGGVITATKDDGTKKDFPITAEMISGFDAAKVGKQTVTVTYETFKATFDVNVTKVSVAKITGITYATPLVGVQYVPAGTFDVTYNNGQTKTLAYPADGVKVTANIDTAKVNSTGSITIEYDGKTFTKDSIEVVPNKIVKAVITKEPTMTSFVEGTAFTADGEVTLTYSDDSKKVVAVTALNCKAPDMNVLGEQTVTINNFGNGMLTDIPEASLPTYKVKIVAKSLVSIALVNTPTSVYETMDIDFTGMTATGTYDNKTTSALTTSGMTTDYDKATAKAGATVPVTVTIAGKTAKFDINVEARTLKGISVKTQPTNTKYTEGTKIDLTGGQLALSYNVGEDTLVDMTADGVTVESLPSIVAPATVKVSYKGFDTNLSIEVVAKIATAIAIKAPVKVDYYQGQQLKNDDMVVTATYNNGTTGVVNNTECTVSGFDSATVGEQTITVAYKDLTATFKVTVNAKAIESIKIATSPKTDFIEEQEFATTGGKLSVKYLEFDKEEMVEITTAMCSTVDMKKLGKQTVTITYCGFTASYDINIVAKKLDSITVVPPTKVEYIQGDDFQKTPVGMAVTAHYDNGKTVDIAPASVVLSGYDKTKVGKQIITATYEEKGITKTATFEVTVISRENVDMIEAKLEEFAKADLTKANKDLYRQMRDLAVKWDSLSAVEKEALSGKRDNFDKQKAAMTALTLPAQEITALNGKMKISATAGNLFYDETIEIAEIKTNDELLNSVKTMFGDRSSVLSNFDANLVTKDGKAVELKDGDKSTVTYEMEVAADSGLVQGNAQVLAMQKSNAKAKAAPTAVEVTVTGNKVAFKGAPNMQYAVVKAEKSVVVPPVPEKPTTPTIPEKPLAPKPVSPATGDTSSIPMLIVVAIFTVGLGIVLVKKKHTK